MANKTTNYGLTKPLPEEFYDVNIQNGNMDIIDENLKKVSDDSKSYTDQKFNSIPTPDVSGQIGTHDADPSAHENIRKMVSGAIKAEAFVENGSDLNTVTVSGIYRIEGAVTNAPVGSDWSQLLVMHGGGDTITQIIGCFNDGKLWTRSGNPSNTGGKGKWTDWAQVYDSVNKPMLMFNATIGTNWTTNESTGVKSQSVSISGVTVDHTAKVDHSNASVNGTSEGYAVFVEEENQYLEFITNGYAETYDGGITFYIFGEANTVSIPIVVEVV